MIQRDGRGTESRRHMIEVGRLGLFPCHGLLDESLGAGSLWKNVSSHNRNKGSQQEKQPEVCLFDTRAIDRRPVPGPARFPETCRRVSEAVSETSSASNCGQVVGLASRVPCHPFQLAQIERLFGLIYSKYVADIV